MLEDVGGLATANLAAWRLVTWVSLLIAAGALADYVRIEWRARSIDLEFARFTVGLIVMFSALGLHQFYWWRNEVYVARGHCHSTDVDYDVVVCQLQGIWYSWAELITPLLYVGMALGMVLVLAPLLVMRYGISCRAARIMVLALVASTYLGGLMSLV